VVVVTALGAPGVVDGLGGEHVLAHEVPRTRADVLGLGGESEVHARNVAADVTGVASGVTARRAPSGR
jgi:hypothetical protein